MIRRHHVTALLTVLLVAYSVTTTFLRQNRNAFIYNQFVEYTIPSEYLKPISLEFKGLASDILLFKFMAFIGGRTGQLDDFTADDWDAVKNALDTITDLDPRFWDAYLFAQVFLTWNEAHFEDANKMLLKAKKFFPDDYRIPYYIGLNYYNFGGDMKKGAQYLMEASQLPGSPYYLASLAARMSAYGSDYERGIIFLGEMLKQTNSPDVAEQYKMRIKLLQSMHAIDSAIRSFQEKYQRLPDGLSELVKVGAIPSIPEDPYGGKFYISDDGRISTTSKMLKMEKAN